MFDLTESNIVIFYNQIARWLNLDKIAGPLQFLSIKEQRRNCSTSNPQSQSSQLKNHGYCKGSRKDLARPNSLRIGKSKVFVKGNQPNINSNIGCIHNDDQPEEAKAFAAFFATIAAASFEPGLYVGLPVPSRAARFRC
jgi:hypothetical protein